MLTIKSVQEIQNMEHVDGNQILGATPKMEESQIQFLGKNNILYCEENVVLKNARITFNGSNALVYLSSNRHRYYINVSINNDSVFYMGANTYINESGSKMTAILSEQKHCFIGDNGLFSFGICFRNADPHLIYDCDSLKRINPTKSIFIGDHVWIGQNALFLKGTQVDSGCIIGANSVVSGKKIYHNSSWGGNPCKLIRKGVFWDGSAVHSWTEEKTNASMQYEDYVDTYLHNNCYDNWIYEPNNDLIEFDELDRLFSVRGSDAKLKNVLEINKNKKKNRFVHGAE